MIVCVSPSSQHYDETHNTLKYANRAKNIKTKVSRNMINVNRHVSQYVKAIYELTQEVEELKKRLGDSTKEAMDKVKKQELQRDQQIKEGSRRLKIAYQNSEGIRESQIQDFKNLQAIERRIALITAWVTAFDGVFSSEAPPKTLLTIRMEAETILQELENNRFGLQHRLQGPTAEREIDRALDAALRNLQGIDGVTESDIASVNADATLYKTMIERDFYQSLASVNTDMSIPVSVLSKAHFEAVASLNQLNLEDDSALDVIRKTSLEVMTACTNATSQIIRPNGELISTQDNFSIPRLNSNTPRKKNANGVMANLSSPLRGPFAQVDSGVTTSPLIRPSPRAFKVGTPKKAVSFAKKSPKKKRVRWQDETEAEKKLVLEENKRNGAEKLHQLSTPSTMSTTTTADITLIDTSQFSVSSTYQPSTATLARYQAESHQSQANQRAYPMEQPPLRRNSKMAMGFLSRKQDTSPPQLIPPLLQPQSTSSNRASNILGDPLNPRNKGNDLPLSEADTSMFNNRPRPNMTFEASDVTEDLSRPWITVQAIAKGPAWSAARRRVSSGSLAGPVRARRLRPHHSSPESSTSVTFRVGHARRMSTVPEKENIGGRGHVHGERHGHAAVLSPKARSSFKSSARRMTISGRTDMAGPVGRRTSIAPTLDRAKIQGNTKPPPWR